MDGDVHATRNGGLEPGVPQSDSRATTLAQGLPLLKLLEQTPSFITVVDQQHRVRFINHPVPGLTHADVIGRSVYDFILPQHRERARHSIERVFRSGQAASYISEAAGPHGSVAWYENQLGPITAEGSVQAVSLIASDISERKRAERELQKREEILSALVETSQDWIWSIDLDGVHTYSNPAVEQILGYRPDELLGESSLLLMHDHDRSQVEAELPKWIAGKRGWRNRLIRWRHRDGSSRYLESNAVPILDADGQLTGFRGVDRDITERRRAEEERAELKQQLLQAQKMEAIGNLAGGIAHDFNNLLTGILGYANVLRLDAPVGSEVREAAEVIEAAAQRAAELTKQLLGFARRGKLREVCVDLHEVVRQTISLLARTIDKRIRIAVKFDADRSGVTGDPGQLQQVAMNLAVNARDAMPVGGELSFGTALARVTTDQPTLLAILEPGDYVVLSVGDTGFGIPETVQPRIFEPFFTTKPQDQGSGMGLAMVHGIVRNHRGAVEFQSEEGIGTTFKVYLPLAPAGSRAVGSEPQPALRRGEGVILMVDDEQPVRVFSQRVLTSLGYEVMAVGTGSEALAQYQKRGAEIDLVILDVTMPGMDGRTCFAKLKELNADVRVVVVTGHAVDGVGQELLDAGAVAVLTKPFLQAQLSEAVFRALQSHQIG